ncbi:CDP-diacylglycerol--glycerol-3-phosphate 3-phosphatidyltransferase, mitochondrial isoform X1 [Tetranychus urticae]|uniref:CDP-diacylglycerol--glycerol-3-phosphate 3-phosphatidyltransferase n=1 Tax=Tetranychus urticae TaxID=32264 RepID=T1L457_TETUR|nr:CDP-diacylglycerol--glycerol-3-phosphate 3-phosphatidyltransferase, mitochondrial isoform X1 [Tetranychus urticae]
MNRLKQLACCYSKTCDKGLIYFRVKSDSIEILQNPQTFYSKLQKLISQSKKRVILSSLYIGTGELEENLINSLHSRLEETKDLRVSILVDYNRGQRLKQKNDLDSSSKGLLRSLAHKANIYFFLSPAFGSYFKRYFILPIQSVNESLSTQHIKCYIGDDDVILSGANLSEDYFTNRQDRYIYVRNCRELCDYLEKIVNLVGKFSFKLNSSGNLTIEDERNFIFHDSNKFGTIFKDNLQKIQAGYEKLSQLEMENTQTLIIPTIQMNYLQITEDFDLTRILFNLSRKFSKTSHLVSGYFNLTKEYIDILTQPNSSSILNILAASEEVNGFYRADGPKKLIPSIYTQKSRDFLSSVQKSTANVNFQLYHRKNWTFHAKGFWTHLDDGSYITTIGSSNYACRSVERDLEMQFLVATVDKNLIDKLENERAQLWRFGAPIKDQNELPQVPLTARMLSKTLGNFF